MAKSSILTILIQLNKRGDGDRAAVKGLQELKSNLALGMGTLTAFAGTAVAVGIAIDKTVTPFINYAAQVREMSRLTGGGAEDMSRLIQAADDVKLSYEGLQKALWAASKQGIDVSVDSISKLADEYVAIQKPAERAEFLSKNFGKSGADMGKLLEMGGQGVREATDAISDNLVLTEQAVQQAREYEIQLDNLNDQWEAMKIGAGQKAVPALTDLMFTVNNFDKIWAERNRLIDEGVTKNIVLAEQLAKQNVLERENTEAITGNEMALRAQGEALREVSGELEEVVDAEAEFKGQMDQLNEILGGELGQAQDDYNAKIAEYTRLLGEAKTQKEQDEINTNIAAETAAYNERAESIMFNIQQEAILNSTLPPETKLDMITDLGVAYGEYDQATADAITSTSEWIERVEAGTLSEEAAIQWMKDATRNMKEQGKAAQGTVNPLEEMEDAVYHAGERALDAGDKLLELKEKQAALGSGIRSDALPASGALARTLGGLPPTGTEWSYHFVITKSGSVPSLPTGGGGGSVYNPDRYEQEFAAGGQLPLGAGWAMVGEQGFEFVSPSGYVFTNQQSRALLAAGLMPEFERRVGGDLFGMGVFTGGGSGGTSQVRKPRRVTSDSRVGNISIATPDIYSYSSASSEIAPPSNSLAVASVAAAVAAVETVADVVEPLAGVTEEAVQAFGDTQQQTISESIQTRNTIASGNGEITGLLREVADLLRQQQQTLPRAISAAVQQVMG